MPDDAVLSVAVDPSGAERGSQVVRRSLEDISRSASTSMSAVERYNTTLGAGATAADIFQRQTAAMAAQLKVLEETSTANARVVANLGLKFEVIRNAAKSAVSALLEFGKTKFTGDVTAQMDRLSTDMTRAMDAGGKGAVAAARASQREILSIAKAGLADQLELVKQEAMKRVAGAQEEWERVKALHLGARTEIAAQERSAAQQALSEAKKSASELVATAKASNAAALQEIKSRTDQIITLKQRENAVQAEYERGYDSLTRTQQQADATLSRLLTTEKEHAAQQVAEAQESERLLAVVRRGIQAREANAAAIVAETNAIREQSTVAQQAGHYSVSNAGLVSSALPALPKAPSSGGREVQQESVDVAALADELDKLVLRYDFASAATARRTEAIDTLRTAQRVGILDDDEEFERLRKLVSGEQQHADALTALKAQYSGASDAERRYATELERVTTILNDASASDADRAAILRNVAQAYDPAIAAAEKTVVENDRLAASYKALMRQIDPAIAQQARYESALADVVAYHTSVGSSTDTMAAAMDHVREKLSPAAIETKKLTDENAKAADSYHALIGQIDTAVGQQQRYESELAKLRAGHQALGISAEQAAIEEAKLTDALSPAGIAAQKEATALQSLLDRLNPADKASRELAAGAELLRKALAAEGADVEKLTASLAKLEAERKKAVSGGTSKGESHMNRQVLGSVGVNTIQSLASGIPIQTVAMTQGTQLLTLLQGGSKALLLYGAAATLTVGPVLALAGAIVIYSASLREIERVSRLTGNAAGMTTAQIVAQADASAKAAGISSASARSIAAQYIGTGKIGGQMLGDLTKATKDWAVATSQDTDKASSDLAGMFVDPAKAAAELAQKYGMFSDAQVQVIKNYQAQGDLERAQSALLDGIKSRTQGAAESVAWYAKAWESVSRNVSDGFTAIGKFGSGKSLDDRISDYERSQRTITQRGGVVQNQQNQGVRFTQRGGIIAAPQEQYAQDLWDFGQRQAQAAHAKTGAAVEKLKSEVMDFARSVDPSINATQSLTNAEALLTKAVGAGAISLQEKTRLLALYGAQLEQTANPAKAFALDMERQAKVMEAAAGRARDFEQQRQAVLQKRGAQPTDALTTAETVDISRGLNAKYDAQANDAHRTATQAIDDARLLAAATAAISPAATVAAQARIAYNATIRSTTDALHPLGDVTKAQQAYDGSLAKGTIELNAQFDASVKTAGLAIDAAGRLAIAQAQGGDIATAMAQAQNVYADQVARGVDPVRALALANADMQKSLATLSGQQAAWNRDLTEQIAAALRLADAEGVSAAAVAEVTVQNRVRAQVVKEGVAADSARAQAIDAGTRALEAQNSAAKVNASIRQQNQDLSVARAEYEMLGLSNAEREKQVAILKATLDVQNSGDWQKAPQETRDAWIAQAGAVAEYKARVADATETSRDFANTITKGFEDAILSGGKLGDTVKALVKDIERIALRSTVTKPLENWLIGTMTKALSPTPVNDNAVQPVNDNDPGGWKAKFDAWTSSGAGTLGASSSNAMWVQLAGGGAALDARATAGGLPMPVAIKDAGDIASLVRSEARAQGVPEEVAVAIAKIESNFRQYRDDGRLLTSSAGAQGVMQLMPDTAKWLGVDASDTRENVRGGIKYLAMLGRQFGGDWSAVAGAYNAGPGRMTANLNQGQALPAETVTYIQKFGTSVNAANAAVVSLRAPVVGVTAAQEAQLQAQLDAVPALKAVNDSTQALTATQQSWVDSALGVTSANSDAASSIAVTARAMDKIGPNAISAADGLKQGATGAAALGDAASDGADTLFGSLKSLSVGVGDWFDGLFGGEKPTQRKVIQNADGSTSMAPAAQGAGGSWLSRPAYSWSTGQASGKGGENAATGEIAAGVESVSWGRVLAGIGGVAAGITTATQKGATAGQKIGGGLTAAGGAVMLIPGGQVVGGVMMAAGALLAAVTGAKDRGTAYSRSNITLGSNGKYALGSYDADNNGDPTKFNADAAKIAKGLNDIAARLNLTPTAGASFIDSKEKSAEQAALELLKGMQSAVPNVAYALAHETSTSLEDALQHLEFASGFDQQIAGLRSSVSDLFSDFKTGVDSANSFAKSLLDVIDNAQTVFAVSKGASLPGFATGTLSAPSGLARVGEEGPEIAERQGKMALLGKSGPELVYLQGGERIWNARESAQMVARLGRGRDDTLIHLRGSDELAAVRRALGSSGRINPATGLLGFDDGDAASGHGGENAAHGETNSSTAGRDSAYGGGWGGSSGGSGGVLDSIASSVSDLTAAVADTLASYAGWKTDTEANAQAQTSAMTAVAGLSATAVAASLSAVASTLGPALSGLIEGVTGVKGSAPAVSHDYGDMGAGGVTGGAPTGGTIGERAAQADRGGSYAGVSAAQIDQTLAALAAAIKSDPSLSGALVGSMRVGGTATNGMTGPTVREIADTQGAALGYFGGDPAQVLQQLDDAAQQMLTATGAIPEVLQRALDDANGLAPLFGATSATSTRQAQEQAAQQQAAALQSQFDGVGLAHSRVSELNDIVKSLGENTFNPIGKDFDKLATDMGAAAKAYTAAGQSVPEGLFAAQRQMEALGAARKRLLDEVAGVTVETSPEQKKVEQLKGAWSATATDLVKAFAAVGIVGGELAAKLEQGFGNALQKEQTSYSKSLDTGLRKVRGEDGYDSAVALADSYETAISDVNALWSEGADRARETGVVTATLGESLLALVKSGGITSKSLTELQAVYASQPAVLAAVTAALSDLTAAAARQQALTIRGAKTTFETALDPSYRAPLTAATALADADVTADLGGFATDLDNFTGALARGAAGAADARLVFNGLTAQFTAGKITGEQYNSLVGTISQGWTTAANAAQTLAAYQADLRVRRLYAEGKTEEADALSLSLKQQREYAAAVKEGADETYLAALKSTQAAEATKAANDSARSSWTSVVSSSLSAAQSLVSQWSSLYDSLHDKRLSNMLGEYSTLSPGDQEAEARQQFRALMAIANDSDPTDAESVKAAGKLGAAGDAWLKASQTVNATADPTVFREVEAGLASVETVAERQLSAANTQVAYLSKIADTLKAMDVTLAEQSRMESVLATPRNWGASESVSANMQLAFKTGYSGDFGSGGWQNWIVQQPESVKAVARQVLTQMGQSWRINGFQEGGVIPLAGAYAEGGVVGNGLWGKDSVLARYAGGGAIALAGGEFVMPADMTAAYRPELDAMRSGAWEPANDRWSGSNIVAYRPPAPPAPAGADNSAAINRLSGLILKLIDAIEDAETDAQDQRAHYLAKLLAEVKGIRAEQLDQLPKLIAGAAGK